MLIEKILNYKFLQKIRNKDCGQNITSVSKTEDKNSNKYNVNQTSPIKSVPVEVLKANYINSLEEYEKIKEIPIKERASNETINASLYKSRNKTHPSFQIRIGDKVAGYMKMDCISGLPFGMKNTCVGNDAVIPCISDLRTILGSEYSGIGTALVKEAIRTSKKNGAQGSLWLYSMEGFEKNKSSYRRGENPLPFYFKLGFRANDDLIDNMIIKAIKKNKPKDLPPMCILFLTPEAADNLIG